MKIKKIITSLLISILGICLFFVFGFQIDVAGGATTAGGTADVTLDPAKVAADQANAAVAAAELALEESQLTLAAIQLIISESSTALAAAEQAVTDAQEDLDLAILNGFVPGDPEYDAALLALEAAQSSLEAVQLIILENEAALAAAEQAVIDAEAALAAAILAAEEANAAYTTSLKVPDEEELAELQLAVEEAQKALDDAIAAGGYTEEELAELQEELDKALAALETGGSGEGEYYHIITNSNNGGSFDMEGNHAGNAGEIVPYTFTADESYELAWIRIGNTKVYAYELQNLFEFSFNKKNLTMHAHFKKVKDSEPDEEVITTGEGTEEGDTGEGEEPPEEETEKKNNGNGKAKGKDKEKSNNGKKKDK